MQQAPKLPLGEHTRRLAKRMPKDQDFTISLNEGMGGTLSYDKTTQSFQAVFPFLNSAHLIVPKQNAIVSLHKDGVGELENAENKVGLIANDPESQVKKLSDLDLEDTAIQMLQHAFVQFDAQLTQQGILPPDTEPVMPWHLTGQEVVDKEGTLLNFSKKLDSLVGLHPLQTEMNTQLAYAHLANWRFQEGAANQPVTIQPMWFVGPTGTGKTQAAKLIGETLFESQVLRGSRMVELDMHDLVTSQTRDRAEVRARLAAYINAEVGMIVLKGVDEIYKIINDNQDKEMQEEADRPMVNWQVYEEIILSLKKISEDYPRQFLVVFMAETIEPMQPHQAALQSWAPLVFYFEPHNPAKVVEMWLRASERDGFTLDLEPNFDELQEAASGVCATQGNRVDHGRLGITLYKRALLQASRRNFIVPGEQVPVPTENSLMLTGEDFRLAAQGMGLVTPKKKDDSAK